MGHTENLRPVGRMKNPFTLELQEVYQWVVEGKSPKTSPTDARQDLEILGMLMKAMTG